MAANLFSAAAEDQMAAEGPLAERLRPASLDDVVGQTDLVGPDGTLRRLVKATRLPSLILWGPPGSGKTTIARLLCAERNDEFVPLSAVTATVADIRREVDAATHRLGANQKRTVLFLDEIHRFTRTQQDALLPSVEKGVLSLVGATTESPWATLVGPLISRCTVLQLHALDDDDLRVMLARAVDATHRSPDDDAADLLLTTSGGDGRKLLTMYEVAAEVAASRGATPSPATTPSAASVRGTSGTAPASTTTPPARSSSGCATPIPSRPWPGWCTCSTAARTLVSSLAAWSSSPARTSATPTLVRCWSPTRRHGPSRRSGLPEARYNLGQAAAYLAGAPKSRGVPDELAAAATHRATTSPGDDR